MEQRYNGLWDIINDRPIVVAIWRRRTLSGRMCFTPTVVSRVERSPMWRNAIDIRPAIAIPAVHWWMAW